MGDDDLDLRDRVLPARFRRWEVVVQPGRPHPVEPADWARALVVVDRGRIEVETSAGASAEFGPGAVLSFDGLAVRALRSCDGEPAVLIVVTNSRGG